jgi:hypothetical protein
MITTDDVAPSTRAANGQLVEDPATKLPKTRIGEELPIFCERCGYSLNGLPQTRCQHCTVLQFHCPECGHHQPINTLRPAFQQLLGRVRAAFLALLVLVQLNVVFWPLMGWVGMGVEWPYRMDYSAAGPRGRGEPRPAPLTIEMLVAFMMFGLAYGAVARMMLLRWRRGWAVGLVLAGLVLAAICVGVWIVRVDRDIHFSLYTRDFLTVMAVGAACVVLAASLVWPVWAVVVNVFLPRKTARAVLDWQRFRATPGTAGALARE